MHGKTAAFVWCGITEDIVAWKGRGRKKKIIEEKTGSRRGQGSRRSQRGQTYTFDIFTYFTQLTQLGSRRGQTVF